MENEFASWAGFIELMTDLVWVMTYTIGTIVVFLGACGLAGGAVILACRLFRESETE